MNKFNAHNVAVNDEDVIMKLCGSDTFHCGEARDKKGSDEEQEIAQGPLSLTEKDMQDLCESPDSLSAKKARHKLLRIIANDKSKSAEDMKSILLKMGKSQKFLSGPSQQYGSDVSCSDRNAAYGPTMWEEDCNHLPSKIESCDTECNGNVQSNLQASNSFKFDRTGMTLKRQSRRLRRNDMLETALVFDPRTGKEAETTAENKGTLLVDFPRRLSDSEEVMEKNEPQVQSKVFSDVQKEIERTLSMGRGSFSSFAFPGSEGVKAQKRAVSENNFFATKSPEYVISAPILEVPSFESGVDQDSREPKMTRLSKTRSLSTLGRHNRHDPLANSGLPIPIAQHKKGVKSVDNVEFSSLLEKPRTEQQPSQETNFVPNSSVHVPTPATRQTRKYFGTFWKEGDVSSYRSYKEESKILRAGQVDRRSYSARTA